MTTNDIQATALTIAPQHPVIADRLIRAAVAFDDLTPVSQDSAFPRWASVTYDTPVGRLSLYSMGDGARGPYQALLGSDILARGGGPHSTLAAIRARLDAKLARASVPV